MVARASTALLRPRFIRGAGLCCQFVSAGIGQATPPRVEHGTLCVCGSLDMSQALQFQVILICFVAFPASTRQTSSKVKMPLLPLMAKRRMVAPAVLVATLFLSATDIATAYHDDVDASTVNRAVMSCDDYSNDRSDYMKNTCSDGAGGKELPPPGQGAGGCDHGTLRCQSWDCVTKYAGCASFIQQFEDGITGGKKYCQKECCKRGEFFPGPAPSPPQKCTPCTNKPSPYMDG